MPGLARGAWLRWLQCPNVVMKLGGVGQPRYGFDWHTRATPIGSEQLAEEMGPLITYCNRPSSAPTDACSRATSPPDKVSFSYNVMYNAFKRMTSGYSASERARHVPTTTRRGSTASSTSGYAADSNAVSSPTSANRSRRLTASTTWLHLARAKGCPCDSKSNLPRSSSRPAGLEKSPR